MPKVESFQAFVIYMYFEDHNPPHVHVIGPDFKAIMAIENRKIIAGRLPGKIEEQATAYVEKHAVSLLERWDAYH